MGIPTVVIVLARCSRRRQGFALRLEEQGAGRWFADWAFAVAEARASREGYDQGEIAGRFDFADTYPGCPHCEAGGIFRCGACGKVSCWDGRQQPVTCAWCGRAAPLQGTIERLRAGGDR